MGIVNITPDSFSDGGHYLRASDAIAKIKRLAAEGAAVIDIGAESTRPGATPLSSDEEWQRLEPVLTLLPTIKNVEYSLDTRYAETAKKALDYGIDWINDVSGFPTATMIAAVHDSRCKLVIMHSLSVPADKNIVMNASLDVVHEIIIFAKHRISELEDSGITRDRIIFDPGIGFGKTASQSWKILRDIERFTELKVPLLVGHSRKSFLSTSPEYRDQDTLTVSQYLTILNVAYLRVHDVLSHKHMLNALGRLSYES